MRRDLDRWWNWLRCLVAGGAVAGGLAWPRRSAADEPPAAATPAAASQAAPQPAYWQVPPLPQAVVQGGVIPPGWQPQAVPYQGIGPDGKPLTMYFAPTYVFTYQAGPPMPAVPQVNRSGWWSGQPSPTMAAPMATGWNYSTSGAPPVAPTLPPGGVTPYRSAYRFPADARALQGTDLSPPGPLPAPPPLPTEAWSSTTAAAPPPLAPPPMVAPPQPPTQWVPSQQSDAAAMPPAAMGMAAGSAAAAAYPPTPASPPPAPIAAVPPPPSIPIQPLAPPPATPVRTHLWRVVGVSDGDSVTCLDETGQQQKVNLAGIEAPQMSQTHGRESREALAGVVFGRVIEVVDEGRDAGGTWSGRLFVDGSDVNRQMVATGNAWCSSTANDPALAAAQTQAQSQRLGLWAQASGDPR